MWLPGAAVLLFMLIVGSVFGIADANEAVPQEIAAASNARSWARRGDAGVVTVHRDIAAHYQAEAAHPRTHGDQCQAPSRHRPRPA